MLFERGPQLVIGQRKVDGHAARLGHVPRRIDEELDAILLGVVEVDRKRIAVGNGAELGRVLVRNAALQLAQRLEAVDAERELVDDVELKIGRSAGGEHDLVMLARIAGHEDDLPAVGGRPAVGDGKAEEAAVEIHHARHVGDEKADVAEIQ